MLFLRINASYKLHLKKQLSHLNVINDGGPQNGYVFSILCHMIDFIIIIIYGVHCHHVKPSNGKINKYLFFLCGDKEITYLT